MTGRMTRRQALGSAAVGGAELVGRLGGSVEATAATSQHTASHFLPDVWGEDFTLQWSPPDDLQKDLTVGASRDAGHLAVEPFGGGWDTVTDGDIRESRDWP